MKKRTRNKIICFGSVLFFLSAQISPVVYAVEKNNTTNLFQSVESTNIQLLKEYYSKNIASDIIPLNLLSKNFKLNSYELLILNESIKKDIIDFKKNKGDVLKNIIDIENKYNDVFFNIFNKKPDTPVSSENITSTGDTITPIISTEPTSVLKPTISSPSTNISSKNQSSEPSDDNLTIFNIKKPTTPLSTVKDIDSINPLSEFNNEDLSKINPSEKTIKTNKSDDYDMLNSLANENLINKNDNKSKDFYVQVYHNIYYVDEHGTGNIPYDTSLKDDNGNYYQKTVTNQYQLEETLDIGLGIKVHKALDLVVGITAQNEDGSIFSKGTSWEFGNILFKFHPEKLKNKTGIKVSNDGKNLEASLGHKTSVGGNTDDGDVGISVGDSESSLSFSDSGGLKAVNDMGKYYLGIGKLSLDLSTYTLKLSNCKAIQFGYKDNDQSITFIYAKPKSLSEGYTDNSSIVAGSYNRFITAVQYSTQTLLPKLNLSFNYAISNDSGTLTTPNGTTPQKTSVYSIAFQSKNLKDTSISGELAHAQNNYNTSLTGDAAKKVEQSGNADYIDISHKFSNRLSSSLHLINIDGSFDSSAMIEDRTGDYLLTTNTGDGLPDYLYASGQKGLDLALNYRFPENAAIAFGYSRYSMTTEGNSTTELYLSGTKKWSINNDNGENIGDFNIQQRFEKYSVSTKDYSQIISDTTLSTSITPWENASLSSNYQHIQNNVEGNENRFDVTLSQNFYPLERVTITPKTSYTSKKSTPGIEKTTIMDVSTLINSITVGYELIPEELTVNLLVSKEKYNVISSEIDTSTGEKVDGEKRDVSGVGIGLSWEPKKIPGLTAAISYRKDNVHYYTPSDDISHQDVIDMKLSYTKPISDAIRASVSYDYHSAKDKIKPIYDEVTRTVEINIDAEISNTSSIKIQHSYESEYKPLDSSANHTTQTTSIAMSNKF